MGSDLRVTGKRLAGALSAGALLAALPCTAQVRDVELKAAYIYNFAQFVSWPPGRENMPLTVCADRASVLWLALQPYNGRAVGARAWRLRDTATRDNDTCDIQVLSRTADSDAGPGVLVVRDGPGATRAAITLVDDDEQLRFDVDTQALAGAGLRASSKLLHLARNVL